MRIQLARVVVELQAPMSIGSGATDDVVDAPVVRDADGLPALPGSSLGGVLRSVARDRYGESRADDWFGAASHQDAAPSKVWVSWGRPHGEDDRPVAPRLLGGLHDDPVLDLLKTAVVRDRVRLNERGVVDSRAKFDQSFVPGGARFTVEIRVDEGGPEIDEVVDWVDGASVGRGTRSGFGRLEVVRATLGDFELSAKGGQARYESVPRALWEPVQLGRSWARGSGGDSGRRPVGTRYALLLRPEQGLLIGGGPTVLDGPDLVWFRERRLVWRGGRGQAHDVALIPGTALRGALRHRARFHLHVICGGQRPAVEAAQEWLFGTDPESNSDFRPGRVRVGETALPHAIGHPQMHVAIDRFTGGPRDGMLFEEESLWAEGLPVRVVVDVSTSPDDDPCTRERAIRALERAMDDLCEGRLGLGHGNSRGHGFFTGKRESA